MSDNGGNGRKGYFVKAVERHWACSKGHSGTVPATMKPPYIEFTLTNRPPIQFCLDCLRDFLYTHDVGRIMRDDFAEPQ